MHVVSAQFVCGHTVGEPEIAGDQEADQTARSRKAASRGIPDSTVDKHLPSLINELAYKSSRVVKKSDGVDHVSRFALGLLLSREGNRQYVGLVICARGVLVQLSLLVSVHSCTAFRVDRWTHDSTLGSNSCNDARLREDCQAVRVWMAFGWPHTIA